MVDDLLKGVIDYFKQTRLRNEQLHADTLSHARKAMRKLASSLSETVAFLESVLHQLERVKDNPQEFSNKLSQLVDPETLNKNCKESGVCEDLRTAQDELNQLPEIQANIAEASVIRVLITEIDGYERQFVEAIREFLAQSRGFDLLRDKTFTTIDTEQAISALKERIAGLSGMVNEIGNLLAVYKRYCCNTENIYLISCNKRGLTT